MKLPNGFGSVYKMSGNRRKPYRAIVTERWQIDTETGKWKQKRKTIGYYESKKVITHKHIKIFIDTCPYFRTYFLYPVFFAFGNNKVYSVVMLFDMPVLIRCSMKTPPFF